MISPARRTLCLVVTLMALPLVAASGLLLSGWRPGATANHGLLIAPPATLAEPAKWQGKWSLLLIHDAPCGIACLQRLDELSRLRISLGQEMKRTRLVWMGIAIASEATVLKARMPDLTTADRRPDGFEYLPPGSVILVDPNGLAMMRYPPGADPKGMRTDLERLLKYAWSA